MTDEAFCTLVLLLGLMMVAATYVWLSSRTGSFVNVLTPSLLVDVPIYFFLEGITLALVGYDGSRFAYAYLFAMFATGMAARAVGYVLTTPRPLMLFPQVRRVRVRGLPFFFLLVSVALYAPLLISNPEFILRPRDLYAATRVGFGLQTFVSTFLIYVGYILLLFNRNRSRWTTTLFSILALGLLYLHGSKGQVLSLLLVYLYFLAFVEHRRFSLARLLVVVSLSASSILVLFYLTFPGALREDLLQSVAGYSAEYTRNALRVIDDPALDLQLGRLNLENTFYAFLPRQLFPEKRKDFGAFWLAARYTPDRFQDEKGAPQFGLGIYYADFGPFAIFYYGIAQFLGGACAKVLAVRLRQRPDAGSFFLFLTFMDIALMPTGTGFPLVLYYLFALGVKAFSGDDFSLRRRALLI